MQSLDNVQEAARTKLRALEERAKQIAENINQISRALGVERETLRQVVGEYGAKRVELLKWELIARGITWCTYCSKVILESEAKLLLVEGREEYSHGYGNAYYGFRGFCRLHRACQKCREEAADKHGTRSSWDRLAKDQSSFYAFRVEKRKDGYYARKFGNWVKLDDENCKLDEPSSELVEKLAEGRNLPPRIEVESKWPSSEERLVIHERVAVAEAV